MIKTLKLPFHFNAGAMEEDLHNFSSDEWIPHFNKSYYEGDWSGIPLRAPKGGHSPLYPDPTCREFEDTRMMERCSYLPQILKNFKCPLETVRLLKLGAGAKIIEHRDYGLGVEEGAARVHIPIKTNPQVEFRLGGEILQMGEGEAWYLNFNLPHSVDNQGEGERIHLVIDCAVDDWFLGFFPDEVKKQALESIEREKILSGYAS